MPRVNLDGKSAIVTGGASGLGHATATALAEAGAHVAVIDLPDDERVRRSEAVAEIGQRATFVPGDVTDLAVATQAVAAATTHGPLRVVVNCAGIATPGKLVGREGPIALDTFRRVLDINVTGTVNVLGQAVAAMKNQELDGEDRGVLINTASIAAFEGQVGQVAYATSKGAVASMTLPLARELARDAIRVMTIAPGLFETPMMAGLPDAARTALAESTLHPHRLGQPRDYALAVLQILENPMLNGSVIRLDGAVRLEAR